MTNLKKSIQDISVDQNNLEPEREIETHSVWLEMYSFRLALISIFSALSIVLAYMLNPFPNIELLTLMIFLSGFIMGKKEGLIVGLISSFIYFFGR